MTAMIDRERFGPWALVTGASSGIGKEFARQIAAARINVVLVARREGKLTELGRSIASDLSVQYRVIAMDLSQEGFIENLAERTKDLDIGLVVSNAGTPNPGEFLKLDLQLLQETLRLNTMAHLDIAHLVSYFLTTYKQRSLSETGMRATSSFTSTLATPTTFGEERAPVGLEEFSKPERAFSSDPLN